MRRASSSSRLLLRITDYGHDNTFFLAKHSMHFGSPLPSEGEGSGVRGQAHSWRSRNHSGNLIQGCVPGIDSAERCPPHPTPCYVNVKVYRKSGLFLSSCGSSLTARETDCYSWHGIERPSHLFEMRPSLGRKQNAPGSLSQKRIFRNRGFLRSGAGRGVPWGRLSPLGSKELGRPPS